MNVHDFEAKAISGETVRLKDYAGKVTLIVNTASGCGLTPQFEGLEVLQRKFKDQGFTVLGFPCNQFAGQEPLDEKGIQTFCTSKYDVTFPMFAKVEVNGPKVHPLYAYLKRAAPGLFGSQAIKWNFTKFLVDQRGEVVARFGPKEEPASIASTVEAVLSGRPVSAGRSSIIQTVARVVLGASLLLTGTGHLTFQRQEFLAQVPRWLPFDGDFVVLASGVVELLLGLSLIAWGRRRIAVGWLTAAFFVAIFPGNISQYINGIDAFGLDTDRARLIRLFFQPVLVLWALWSTGAWRGLRSRVSGPKAG